MLRTVCQRPGRGALRYRNDADDSRGYHVVMALTGDTTIEALLSAHPRAIRVLMRHRMLCVGCLMARFETVHDAAAVYGLDERELFEEIERENTP